MGVSARAGGGKGVVAGRGVVARGGEESGSVSKVIEVGSPDGQIRFVFRFTDGLPEYSVFYKGVGLVDRSTLSLTFLGERNAGGAGETSEFGRGLVPRRPVFRDGEDNYELVVGKTKTVHDRYREVEIPLVEGTRGGGQRRGTKQGDGGEGQGRRINLVVRVFNDGLAFRYVLPEQTGWNSYSLTDEHSSFRLTGDPILLASFLPGFTSSHEGLYTRLPFSKAPEDSLMDMPVFISFPQHIYVAITEARLLDYAGMYLVRHKGELKSELSPLPGEAGGPVPVEGAVGAGAGVDAMPGSVGELEAGRGTTPRRRTAIRVKAVLPHQTPWRVMLISDRAGALVESNIITDLNDDCAIKDVSWIRPGKTDFHWWNGDIVPDTTFPPGINFETNQYYIDFCGRNGIEYHSVIGYGGIAWYTNDGVSYDAGPHADVTRPVPGLDMQQICDYAKKKGVGIRVWVHWKALYPMIDKAFAQFEQWGIRGMMVDFLNRDDQQMVNIQTEILQKAAAHHLHIQFHGAYKPTGLSRTWPNEFTREGTLNYENDKWGRPITPDDDLNVVFTRLLAGPTDYHLGGYRAVTPAEYKAQYTRPLVLGTRCHMLAMYVVLESYLGMVCDYPAAYEGQDGFDFLKAVPTTWDETRVPEAIPGERVTIARRKGDDWYVGTINNSVEKQVHLSLHWLPPGFYTATIYSDAPDAGTAPDHLRVETRTVSAGDSLLIRLASGGGQVMRLTKK
jgi:alpha-glucosidase